MGSDSSIGRLLGFALTLCCRGVRIADPSSVAADADLVLVAVPDPDLPSVVEELVGSGSVGSGQFVVHPAGRLTAFESSSLPPDVGGDPRSLFIRLFR